MAATFAPAGISAPQEQRATPLHTAVFRVRGLTKIYHMGDVDVPALRSVDLDLLEGEFLVLLGAARSGKSTPLNILGGLDSPTSGSVVFRERELSTMKERELTQYRRQSVGFVFQFYNLIPSFTARENVELVTDCAAHRARRRPLHRGGGGRALQ